MIRSFKQSLLGLLVFSAAASVQAFSLLGPFKPYQLGGFGGLPGGIGYAVDGSIGGAMGLFEDYRWNVRDVYYAYDQSFLNYFGTRGAQAVDEAFAILNALPPVSQMSPSLSEFPQTDMLRANYRAQALSLFDVKSRTLEFMMEELGLADPIRFTWALRARNVETIAGVQFTNYAVIKLNFDPVTLVPSSFVNGALFGYDVVEPIRGTPGDFADAIERPLDTVPFANGNPTPMASSFNGGASVGEFWIGLTRDDVGGLRHLLRTNNFNVETVLPGSLVAITNRSAQLLLTNQDLTTFIARVSRTTNDPATLLNLYPDLVITSTNAFLTVELQTNLLSFFTNAPFPSGAQVTNVSITTNFVTLFDYTFGNVVTNTTNGSFYLIPGNLLGYEVVTNLATNMVAFTNLTPGFGFFVNTNIQIPITTSNLNVFLEQARTNSPAQLQTIYPDLLITSTYTVITNQSATNFTFILTNPPYAPAGTAIAMPVGTVSNSIVTNFFHTFANLITNNYYTTNFATSQRIEVYPDPFAPAGSGRVRTNVVNATYVSNFVNGSFYIIPTNLVGFQLIAPQITNLVALTNPIQPAFFGTNITGTNVTGTNVSILFTNRATLIYDTNYTFSAYPIQPLILGTSQVPVVSFFTNIVSAVYPIEFQSASNSVGIRPGVEKITFHRVDFDSLIGSGFIPVTNQYVDIVITNSRPVQQVVRRIISQPDILFLSEDLGLVNNLTPFLAARSSTTNWINNDLINGQSQQGGPGVIRPPIQIRFTDQLPFFLNTTPFFLDENTAFGGFVWGSFDGTTNTPVVYPDIFSIQDLENQILQPPPPPP